MGRDLWQLQPFENPNKEKLKPFEKNSASLPGVTILNRGYI